MTLNCAIGVILINLIILGSFIIGVVLPIGFICFMIYKLFSLVF
jgi:hypothetical protein